MSRRSSVGRGDLEQVLAAHQPMPSDTDLTEDLSRQFGRPRG